MLFRVKRFSTHRCPSDVQLLLPLRLCFCYFNYDWFGYFCLRQEGGGTPPDTYSGTVAFRWLQVGGLGNKIYRKIHRRPRMGQHECCCNRNNRCIGTSFNLCTICAQPSDSKGVIYHPWRLVCGSITLYFATVPLCELSLRRALACNFLVW